MKGIDVKYKNFFVKLSLKNMIAGKVKRVTTIKLNEKKPNTLRICKISFAQEKLYDKIFQGNPVIIFALK